MISKSIENGKRQMEKEYSKIDIRRSGKYTAPDKQGTLRQISVERPVRFKLIP